MKTDEGALTEAESTGNPLGYAPVTHLIRRFALPSVVGLLVGAVYNITDQIFIGRVVGMLGNAATNVAFPSTILTNALAQLIGVGAAANFNILMGAKKEGKAQGIVGTGLSLTVICACLLTAVVLIFKTPILILCGATENVMPYADVYFGITAIGLPFFLFTQAASPLIRADGSPVYFMFTNLTGAVLNIFLDWLFMFVFDLGIQGAAAATVAGQVVSFLLCAVYFMRFRAFGIRRGVLRVKLAYAADILKLGASNFINQLILAATNIILNNSAAYYGAGTVYGSDIPLAVSGVTAKLNSILMSFAVGIAQGCQPIFGFNMGRGNYARVKETYIKALTVTLSVSFTAFAFLQIFPRQIVGIFGQGDELYFDFAEHYIHVFMMMVCVLGVQPLSTNYFAGTGNVRQGVILSLSRRGFFLIPLLFVLPIFFGLEGVLYSGPAAEFLACVLALSMVFVNIRNLGREKQDKTGATL